MRGRPPNGGGTTIVPQGRTRSRTPRANAEVVAAATMVATIAAQHEGAQVISLHGDDLPQTHEPDNDAMEPIALSFYRRKT